MTPVVYLAHPVGADPIRRQANVANARGWLHWLVDVTNWAIAMPWLPYVEELDEETYRSRGIADDLAMLERCDMVIMAGGRISPGMDAERIAALKLGLPVIDLTSFGFYPPAADDLQSAAALSLRAKHALSRGARRSWMPPLVSDDIESLRAARSLCRLAGDEADVLAAIIQRAEILP